MFKNLIDMLHKASVEFNGKSLFNYRVNNNYESISYKDYYEKVLILISGFKEIGLKAGDKVFLFSDNRLEWMMIDFALQGIGAISVPRGTDTGISEIEFILEHSQSGYIIIESIKAKEKLTNLKKEIIKIGIENNIENVDFYFGKIFELGKTNFEKNKEWIFNRISEIKDSDIVTLIYTSGTTGNPKGVMLNHRNFLHNLINAPQNLAVYKEDVMISVLPIWHIFERTVEYVMIENGASIYYSSIKSFVNDVKIIRPTMIIVVPRILEVFYDKVQMNLEKLKPVKRYLFNFFYRSSLIYFDLTSYVEKTVPLYEKTNIFLSFSFNISRIFFILFKIIGNLLFKSIRNIMGGKVRVIISGGGSLPFQIDKFFSIIGLNVIDGYGLTETSPIICLREPLHPVIGTSGKPVPETEIRIVTGDNKEAECGEKGELLVKGNLVMQGYYKNPEATDKAIRQGWFHTGDVAVRTYYGEVKILGRIKDTIVLSGGENVEPEKIESYINRGSFITHSVVVGQNEKRVKALIVPDKEKITEYAENKKIEYSDYENLINSKEIYELIKNEIDENVNKNPVFKPFEKIFDFKILPKQFEIGDELTQSLKLKRHIIYEKYKHIIDEIFKKK